MIIVKSVGDNEINTPLESTFVVNIQVVLLMG